jgi:hypothetical protein
MLFHLAEKVYDVPLLPVYVTVPVLPPFTVSGVTPEMVPVVFIPFVTRTPLFSADDEYVSTT